MAKRSGMPHANKLVQWITLVLLCLMTGSAAAQSAVGMISSAATNPASASVAPAAAIQENAQQNQVLPAGARGDLKSLFFTPDQIRNINYAVNIYRKNARGSTDIDDFDEEDFLSRLTSIRQTPQTNRFYQYPQFFLESLVYHAADNWIIWVSGQKITQATPSENTDLIVESINQDNVSLLWRPAAMDKVLEVWSKSSNPRVTVNRRAGTVQFTLRPNQTFSSYVMDILEGKVKPVTADTHAITIPEEEPSGQDLPADGQLPAGDTGEVNQNNQGLGGLIGAYQRLGDPATEPTPEQAQPSPATPPNPSIPIPSP